MTSSGLVGWDFVTTLKCVCLCKLSASVSQGEGISYRGRLLIEIDCYEGEPDDTGTVEVEDISESDLAKLPKVLLLSY